MIKRIFNEVNGNFLKLSEKDSLSRNSSTRYLALITIIILIIRFFSIDTPLTDRTEWKEIDYINISQNYLLNGFNISKPTISWPAEPPRVTAMEFPLVPYFAAILYKVFGFNSITIRFLTLIAFILIIIVLFKLVNQELGPVPALFSSAIAGFMPLTSVFGNMLNTYPVAILTGLTSIYFFSKWLDSSKVRVGIISCCLFSLTLLLMPTELTIIIPLTWLYYRKNALKVSSWRKMILFVGSAMILPLLWYVYAYYLSKTSIDVFGVFGGHNKYQTKEMLSTFLWYKVIFYRILTLLSGKVGAFFTIAGLFLLFFYKKGRLFFFYGISFAAFLIIVAEGNLDAPYRQFCGIPAMSAFFGIGLTYCIAAVFTIIDKLSKWSFRYSSMVLPALILTCFYLTYKNHIFLFDRNKFDPVNVNEWNFSKIIRNNSETGSRIITAGTYSIHKGGNDLSPVLYYYSARQGWTLKQDQFSLDSIEILRKKGAVLFAIENISREKELQFFTEILKKRYKVIYQNENLDLILLDIRSQF
jgi:hypothetical protein